MKKIFFIETREEQHRGATDVFIFESTLVRQFTWGRRESNVYNMVLKTFYFVSVCEMTLFYTL